MSKKRGTRPTSDRRGEIGGVDRIHVPIVHGIGETSQKRWAEHTLTPILKWWQATSNERITIIVCPDCGIDRDHEHVRINNGPEVVLDPILWGDQVADRGYFATLRWLMRAAVSIWLINVVAALFVFARPEKRVGSGLGWMLRQLRLALGLVMRAVIVIPGVTVCAALLVSPALRVKIGHALAWTEGDRGENRLIQGFVRSAIEAVDADKRILVGHSQGGSILATISGSGALGKGNPLLTLGSGHALLATQRVLGARRRTLPTALALTALFLGAMSAIAFQLVSLLLFALQGLGHIASATVLLASGIWVLGINPSFAETRFAEASAASVEYMSAMWLSGLDGAAPMAIVTFVFLSLLVWFGKLATASLHAEILEKNRTDAAGFDIIARHDPVSSALEFLGNQCRLVRVSQTDSVVLDHVNYFGNGLVLSEICRVIEAVAHGREVGTGNAVEGSLGERGSELRAGLITRRWASLGVAAVAGSIVIGILGPHPVGFVVALVAIATTAAVGVYARRNWLNKMTTLGGFDDYRRAIDLGRVRAGRRSQWMATTQGVCALVFLSFSVVPVLPPSADWYALMALEGPAMGVGVLLAVGAVLAACGSFHSDLVAVAGFSFSALIWFSVPQPIVPVPVVIGVLNIIFALVAGWRLFALTTPGPVEAISEAPRSEKLGER
ncbi:hypothetical protein [Prescottella equi]|uniref:hypothetical protein n=1 Tax=Rhodococcus hoagii TaxID=43767 RepID=UPI00111C1BA6|nr:hypothetical protein [Prescottella equi]